MPKPENQEKSCTMTEQWRTIKEFPTYEISNFGRVRNSVWGYIRTVRPARNGNYLYVTLHKGRFKKNRFIHRLILTEFVGPANRRQCRHLNGNACDNRIENLKWGTCLENNHDKKTHGTERRGSRHQNSKLDESQVLKIRELFESGYSQTKISKLYNISLVQIHRIVHKKRWQWL